MTHDLETRTNDRSLALEAVRDLKYLLNFGFNEGLDMKWMGLLCLLAGTAFGMPDQAEFDHITQDRIDLDLATGELLLNDQPVRLDELAGHIETAYSISFNAAIHSDDSTGHSANREDLFSDPGDDVPDGPAVVSAEILLRVLEQIDSTHIVPELVRLDFVFPVQLKRNQYHHIELTSGGPVVLNGTAISVADLAQLNSRGNPFVIDRKNASSPVDYRQLLSVLRAIGGNAEIAGLEFVDEERISVEAVISSVKPDGTRDVHSAPKVTVTPGTDAMIRVVTNGAGKQTYEPWMDEFHQEDLANLGIRFSVNAQIIGEYIRVSGVVILTKLQDRAGLFLHNGTPVASYTCSKVVVPIEVVLPPGIETVEFPVVKIDGKEAFCRVRAVTVDKRGMTKAQRERAREAARITEPIRPRKEM
ncbi:hypothetical protein P4E94_13765 [Pontiellaceae bacterium B12219]|nr:hypothetical protein [Pontiellaceae bacterium B12219]